MLGDAKGTGDFNGDGIATIGIFRDGLWMLDDNGDGQWLPGDTIAVFGEPLPAVISVQSGVVLVLQSARSL